MADAPALFSPQAEDGVLAKAREEVLRWHESNIRALDGAVVPESVRPGCDVTLSHMALSALPAELIDIIKDDVARLALDNNRLSGLSGLSLRLPECLRLRYLVMRNNQLREFPQAILSVPTLELLDLKGNKITSLPENLSRLRNLRIFSVHHNRINNIPLCVGQMNSLIHFAARKNPINFPPPEVWLLDDSGPNDKVREDQRISTETKKLKAALVAYSRRERLKAEADSELSEENVETPRPARRKTSGRFPIKPTSSTTDVKDESAVLSPPPFAQPLLRPPIMPSRSAARLPTQPQTATFRPHIAPPFIGLSERNRSNSESQMSASSRAKRFGIMARKPVPPPGSDVDHGKNLSHLRGLSHGSALQNGAAHGPEVMHETASPGSPEGERNATFIRRLSSLPEGKRKSQMHDPTVELARGIVYALDQISSPIKHVISPVRDGKRTSLERTLRVGISFTTELDHVLCNVMIQDEETEDVDKGKHLSHIRTLCLNCIRTYEHILMAMQQEIRTLILHNSPQRIRTLMHMLYASLIELRNACSKLGIEFQSTPRPFQRGATRGRYLSPASIRPTTSLRVRDRTPLMGSRPSSRGRHTESPSSQSSQSTQIPAPYSAASRNGSMSSLNGAVVQNGGPRNASESFPPYERGPTPRIQTRMTRSDTLMSVEESDEEAQFETIYLKLTAACDFASQALPRCQRLIAETTKMIADRGGTEADITSYEVIGDRCKMVIDAVDALRKRLAVLRLKEPEIRANLDFWQLCTSFTRAYAIFAGRVKDCYHSPANFLPEEVKHLLKPLQRSVKDVSKAVNDSAWGYLAATPGQQPGAANRSTTNIAGLNNAVSDSTTNYTNSLRGRPPRSRTNTLVQQQRHTQLSLTTRGITNPPPNGLDPLSAASTHSASGDAFPLGLGLNGLGLASGSGYATPVSMNGGLTMKQAGSTMVPPPGTATSGYVTPLPATPLSAALGPAASATVPLPVSLPLSNLAAGGPMNGGGPTALGGLLPTATSGMGQGLLAAVPTAPHGIAGVPPPAAIPGLVGAGNAAQQGMVSGLQGYLSAAGAVPISGLPMPSMLGPYSGTVLAGGSTLGPGAVGSSMTAITGMATMPPIPPIPQMSHPTQNMTLGTPMERARSLSQRR